MWDEVPPGGGEIHFKGFAYACSITDPIKILEVSINGDVGGDTKFEESNQSSKLTTPRQFHPGTPAPGFIRTDQAYLTLEGKVHTKKGCVCTISQDLQIVFEIDFQVRNAWIRPAFGSGGEVNCSFCGSGAAAAAFVPMTFANDLLIDLEPISQSDRQTANMENP